MDIKGVYFLSNQQGVKTHAVIPIDAYEAFLALKSMVKNTASLSAHELYTMTAKHVTAEGYPSGRRFKPSFVVLKGSKAALICVKSLPFNISELREKLIESGKLKLDKENDCFVFTADVEFSSASSAAAVIAGNVRNGLDVWTNREGFSLKHTGFGVVARKNKKGLKNGKA